MQHLTLEALARLVDEPAEPNEAGHLRDCLVCRRELEALRAEVDALAALPDPAPPAGGWDALEARLLAEGLIREPAPPSGTAPVKVMALYPRSASWRRLPLRAAAAVALFVAGGATGAALWTRVQAPAPGSAPLAAPPAVAVSPAPGDGAEPEVVYEPEMPGLASPPSGVRLAVDGGEAAAPPAPPRRATPETAREREVLAAAEELVRARDEYAAALLRLAELADPASGADPQTRLWALDELVATTRSALDRSPDDPVVNGYHLAALEERESLLRQVRRQTEATWF